MNWKLSLAAFSFCAVLFACKKEDKQVPVQIVLTDNPTDFDEVNVDITDIRVKLDKDTTDWISLNTKAGVYNLLALQNGIMDTLATGTAPTGILKEVRFILGSRNTVKVNGVMQPLVIPSGSESGLKIKIDKHLGETLNSFVLDFDAALSIKQENDGYKLRPVIKLK
ncbi:DUF4382 domain-containing protein [Flavisolibacter ginsenosidimutans]|uniref:DUF4382 domain-containing protein n=1 Tax=Flavisolibacter ginsenosidimutans TaxID=661481 RepID=A0A5B8UN81_9BACT|nr:DUF4382 domain-containing protein [Flavisolibacter ginsenosidimutans]QEC57822.1 DUF4382 domain-containing protein [Flavisolibacter ginsenosidimutans]